MKINKNFNAWWLKKHLRYLNFDNCLINFFIKKLNKGSESRASERGNENLKIQNLLCIWSLCPWFPGLANWKNQKHHWDSEESQFQPVFGYVLQVYSSIFWKNFKISSNYSDALLPDPLFTFLMKKLIKQLSKFKYLKCFFKPSCVEIFVNFHLYSFFWELFLPLGKRSGFHIGVLWFLFPSKL
jgi:hypothetical protein